MISNKKLSKQYRTILAASISAKALLEVEAEKVDEKYRKLAEQEKKDITANIESLNKQIEMCNSFLEENPNTESEQTEPVEATVETPVETLNTSAPADSLFSEEEATDTLSSDTEDNEEEATVEAIDEQENDEDEEESAEEEETEEEGEEQEPEWPEW